MAPRGAKLQATEAPSGVSGADLGSLGRPQDGMAERAASCWNGRAHCQKIPTQPIVVLRERE